MGYAQVLEQKADIKIDNYGLFTCHLPKSLRSKTPKELLATLRSAFVAVNFEQATRLTNCWVKDFRRRNETLTYGYLLAVEHVFGVEPSKLGGGYQSNLKVEFFEDGERVWITVCNLVEWEYALLKQALEYLEWSVDFLI